MNSSEIQIQFPRTGQWEEFTLTAIYQDADGYTRIDRYTQDEIPADHAPAMQAVVAALVGLGEDWQAVQVWATQDWYYPDPVNEDDPIVGVEAVYLAVEAVNPHGGRRIFTSRDYSEFTVASPAAVDFFKYFTKRK